MPGRDAIAAVRWRARRGVGRWQGDDPGVLPQRLSTSIQTPDVTAIRAKTSARARLLPQRPHSMDAQTSTGGHAFRRRFNFLAATC